MVRSRSLGWKLKLGAAAALVTALLPNPGNAAAAADTSRPVVDAAFAHGDTLPAPGGRVTLSGNASDDVGVTWVGIAVRDTVTKLWLQDDGVGWGSFNRFVAHLDNPGRAATGWDYELALPAGSYVLSALARDAAGNEGRIKPWRWFKLTEAADTTPPVVEADLVHRSEHTSPVVLTGLATDAGGIDWVGIAIRDRATDLWLQDDEESWGGFNRIWADTSGPSTAVNWSKQLALPAGDYMLSVRAKDLAGNRGWISPWRAFTISGDVPPPPPPRGSGRAVIVAAGDISTCANDNDTKTAELIDSIIAGTNLPVTVVPVGDLVYEDGTAAEFANCYDPTWGRHKSYTQPVVGNHEYQTTNARGYYQYFGAAAHGPDGYYRWTTAGWGIYALNTVCGSLPGGCSATSPQVQWLRDELDDESGACQLAFMHHPRFVGTTPTRNGAQFWKALDESGADVVVSGHAHYYAESRLQDWQGNADARGIRQFIVGTGGRYMHDLPAAPHRNQVVLDNSSFGVLVLELADSSYEWEFRRVGDGRVLHSGSGVCG